MDVHCYWPELKCEAKFGVISVPFPPLTHCTHFRDVVRFLLPSHHCDTLSSVSRIDCRCVWSWAAGMAQDRLTQAVSGSLFPTASKGCVVNLWCYVDPQHRFTLCIITLGVGTERWLGTEDKGKPFQNVRICDKLQFCLHFIHLGLWAYLPIYFETGVSLCSPECRGTPYVDYPGLQLPEICLPLPPHY